MSDPDVLELTADVLIGGGGMAACWAGITAARAGAQVVLVDKGFVGTSGVTATGGPNHWWVRHKWLRTRLRPWMWRRRGTLVASATIMAGTASPNRTNRAISITSGDWGPCCAKAPRWRRNAMP
ncbi:FAD-dependent oxidoreductase [Sphingobium aquiterrae]|uniref:FAD-dependent oxidoreductase n=1 Tax=Sphingobium aquiterrae TaxID=2038656 RepID=UPI003018FF0C